MEPVAPRSIISLISSIREGANLVLEQELGRRGFTGIVPAHGLVLSFLFRQSGPIPIKALVRKSGRVKSTVTGMVNTLEKHGYLYKQASPEDARSTLIGLTEKGLAMKEDFEEISVILQQQVYGDMPADDRQRLVELLAVLCDNLKR